jgi:hypothetical protein
MIDTELIVGNLIIAAVNLISYCLVACILDCLVKRVLITPIKDLNQIIKDPSKAGKILNK